MSWGVNALYLWTFPHMLYYIFVDYVNLRDLKLLSCPGFLRPASQSECECSRALF